MRRLMRVSRVDQDEQGAVAVVVAILLVVLFGFTALAVDGGAIYSEHRQLRNGADAGSLAVAQDLAKAVVEQDLSPSVGDLGLPFYSTAEYYADANASDGASDVDSVTLGTVEDDNGNTVDLTNAGEVTVVTLVNDAGENELAHWFAPVIGIDSSPIRASASAIYGPVVSIGAGFPVAICEELYAGPDTFVEIEIKVGPPGQEEEVPTECQHSDNWDGPSPGNFNWLETDGSTCEAELTIDDESQGDPGADMPPECTDDEAEIRAAIENYTPGDEENRKARTRYLVIFSEVNKGGKADYTVSGLVAFEFTGINLKPGDKQAVIPPPNGAGWLNPQCGQPPNRCVQGYFRGEIVDPGEVGGIVIVPGAESDLFAVQLTK